MRKTIFPTIFAVLLFLATIPSIAISQNIPGSYELGTANGIPYASGGVGKDEQMDMQAFAGNYNVKMVFVDGQRAYTSGVEVKVMSHDGNLLLDKRSNGPWFWLSLPKGDYEVIADLKGREEKKDFKVGSAPESFTFVWGPMSG